MCTVHVQLAYRLRILLVEALRDRTWLRLILLIILILVVVVEVVVLGVGA